MRYVAPTSLHSEDVRHMYRIQRFWLHNKTVTLKNKGYEKGLPPCRRSRKAGGVYTPIGVWLGAFKSHIAVVQGGVCPLQPSPGSGGCLRAVPPSLRLPACSPIFLTSSTPPNCTSLLLTVPGLPPQRRRRVLGGSTPPSCTSSLADPG